MRPLLYAALLFFLPPEEPDLLLVAIIIFRAAHPAAHSPFPVKFTSFPQFAPDFRVQEIKESQDAVILTLNYA